MMISKALIPIAGKATRLMPVTSVIPKAMFPLVDVANQIKCVVHVICEQAISAGVRRIGIVVSPSQIDMVRQYFTVIQKEGIEKLPVRIDYITQMSPRGFGDAVLQGLDFVGEEPFMLLLGDHVHIRDGDEPPCTVQIARAFDCSNGVAMIGVQPVETKVLSRVGIARGVQIERNIYRCTRFIEKPDLETARLQLVTSNLPEDTFLAHSGIYIFSPEIFDCLLQISARAQSAGNEIELADAQNLLLKRHPERYFLCKIAGQAYDVGTPFGYAETQAIFNSQKEEE